MSTLTQQAALAQDPLFQTRVSAAMVAAAEIIAAQTFAQFQATGGDGPTYTLRGSLATLILTTGGAAVLPRFAFAAAVSPALAADIAASPVAIAASTASLPSLVTTVHPHGLATGDIVSIANHLENTVINGSFAVTVIDGSAFTVPVLGTGFGGGTGTVTKQPSDADVATAVQGAWSGIAGATAAT